MPRTDFIDISSNESSPMQNHPMNTTQSLYPTNTTIDITLALTIPPPTISQTISTQEVMVSPLAPRALVFSTLPSLPLKPHPFLTSLDDLPPRNSNPLPSSLSQGLSQTLLIPTPVDFEPSFPLINPSINGRISPVALASSIMMMEPQRTGLQYRCKRRCEASPAVEGVLVTSGFKLSSSVESSASHVILSDTETAVDEVPAIVPEDNLETELSEASSSPDYVPASPDYVPATPDYFPGSDKESDQRSRSRRTPRRTILLATTYLRQLD
ncbi:hypothetical protein Tco_0891988 [Tanacetum coccineum]|uniref:Uncharacterized protein n=1 Tax=Tanacetum coccineum TaxID=301880 RepID=A0ABQ5C7U1_9ASTR